MTNNKQRIAIGIGEETFQNKNMIALIESLKDHYEVVLISDSRLKNQKKWENQLKLNIISDDAVIAAYESEFECDVFLFLPLTGEYLSKLANGLMDTVVLKMAKLILAKDRPIVVAIATQDALSLNGNNLMKLMVTKQIYFVPFYQDNPIQAPNSLVADFSRVNDTIRFALKGKQLQPIILARDKDDNDEA